MRFSTKAKRAPGVSLAGSGAHAERKKGSGSTAQPSATHGTIAERKKGSGSSAQVFLGDAAASKDPRQQSQMRFSNEKRGPGVSLADDGIVAERKKGSGWSAQVGDTWLSKDVFTIALVCEQGSADACIGVVGRNFFAQNWNVPLQECSHAAVLELATGKLYNKGQAVPRVLPRGPVGDGERFNLVVDMMEREMKIERLATIEGLEEVRSEHIERYLALTHTHNVSNCEFNRAREITETLCILCASGCCLCVY